MRIETKKTQPTKSAKQNTLKKFGFNHNFTKQTTTQTIVVEELLQTQLNNNNNFINTFKGRKISPLDKHHIRIFFINIKGLKMSLGTQSLINLCMNLKILGVGIISLTETNVHWKRNHVVAMLKSILKDAWPANRIAVCTSESEIDWNADSKPGGTAMISVNKLSSVIIEQRQDPSGMGRWTYSTI